METPQNYVTVQRRPPDVEDYIDMLRRYRSWVIGPTFAGLVIAVVVAFWWPDMYESEAILRIMPQSVPASILPAAVVGAMNERLQQLEVEILGRPTLISIITDSKYDLYKKERNRRPLDDVAEDMRTKSIHVDLYSNPGATAQSHAQAFAIKFKYYDKLKAQAVVRELTTRFEESNYRLQENQAASTATLVGDLLKTAKDRLETAQAEMAKFTAENQGRLPENYQGNYLALSEADHTIQATEDQIARDQMQKANAESELTTTRQSIEAARNNLDRVEMVPGPATVRNQDLAHLNETIRQLELQLEANRRKYNENMPDVTTLKGQIERMKEDRDRAQKEEEASNPGAPGATPKLVQNPNVATQIANLQTNERRLQLAISNFQTEIESLGKRLATAEKGKLEIQGKIASSPAIVQRYTTLQQELMLAKEKVDQESRHKDQSDTMKDVEAHKAGEYLDVLENATLPETASEPNRWAIVGVGTLFGMLAGFAMAGAKELKNTSLKNLKDVRAYTNLAILSSIPLLENALLVRRKRRLAWLAWSSAIIIGGILMCGAAYYHFSGSSGPV